MALILQHWTGQSYNSSVHSSGSGAVYCLELLDCEDKLLLEIGRIHEDQYHFQAVCQMPDDLFLIWRRPLESLFVSFGRCLICNVKFV